MCREDPTTWIISKNFDLNAMGDNLVAILEQSTSQEIKSGRSWYSDCNKLVGRLAKKYDHNIQTVTGILASLSPETNFSQNVKDTIGLLTNGDNAIVTTYEKNRIKALKILSGELDIHDHYSQAITKTAGFYFNILQPLDITRVTIDRHSSRVVHGYYLTGSESRFYYNTRVTIDRHSSRVVHGYYLTGSESRFYYNTRAKYQKTEGIYFSIAEKYDLLPQQLQAITWLTYRRLIVPARYKQNDVNFSDIIL